MLKNTNVADEENINGVFSNDIRVTKIKPNVDITNYDND